MDTFRRSAFGSAVFRSPLGCAAWGVLATSLVGCGAPVVQELDAAALATSEERGRYVVEVGGCNDCHTEGFMEANGEVAEELWLTGSRLGFRGPWGTSYPPNLRLTVQRMSEDEWSEMTRTRIGLPPMPWPSLAAMTEEDRRAVYRYLRSLGAAGEPAPLPLSPGAEPQGPWMDFTVHDSSPPQVVGETL